MKFGLVIQKEFSPSAVKNMGLLIKLIVLSTICLVTRAQLHEHIFDYFISEEDENPDNMCPETEEYEDSIVIPSNFTVQETVETLCFSFSIWCTKIVNVTKQFNKTVSVWKTKTVFSCCKGYEKLNNGKCQAVCPGGCVNGNCTKANICECDTGWEGENCTTECSAGWYGNECDYLCNCHNGATCDRFNGTCHCTKGYIGKYCETACVGLAVGDECVNECKCENGGQCREPDGICECPPGYRGDFCEEQCEEGTFGVNCSEICTCDKEKTEICNLINGKCECAPGWKGDNCDKPCEMGSWGRQCDNKCNCGPSGTCHHILGQCLCAPGWYGINCEEKCPNGFFEQDCKMKCPDCPHEPGTCHHETGWCFCPPGVTGPFCHLECPAGKYGANCSEFCLCNNNSTCDPITGVCSCTPGWRGTECSIPCPEGTYGINCSMSCNCSKTDFCDSTNGSCLSIDKLMLELRQIEERESLFPPVYVNALLGVFGFICVAIALAVIAYKFSKKEYFSNLYQNLRTRFQGSHLFKTSELKKEDSSTTSVFQEEINPSGQFVNPMYEATDGIDKSGFRPKSTVNPICGIIEPNHNTHTIDNFEEVAFSIPEPVYSSPGSPSESSDIRISFGSDFQHSSVTTAPVIKYSNPGQTYFFPQTDRKSPECFDNTNVDNVNNRYENITEDGNPQITK